MWARISFYLHHPVIEYISLSLPFQERGRKEQPQQQNKQTKLEIALAVKYNVLYRKKNCGRRIEISI